MCCPKEAQAAGGGLLVVVFVAALILRAVKSAAAETQAQMAEFQAAASSLLATIGGVMVTATGVVAIGSAALLMIYTAVRVATVLVPGESAAAGTDGGVPLLTAGVVGALPVGDCDELVIEVGGSLKDEVAA